MRVFSLVARGEETESSDIDILVDDDLQKISPWLTGDALDGCARYTRL